jgi:AraC-like DNA-binding protein
MDDAFLKKAVEAVERHMGEEAFGVTELGEALAMSRVQLHRKITALTDRPPGEFIRYLRLHRAMELLKRDAGTVSEIAYSVGFSDPSHFTRRFRELFGTLPSDVRKNPSDQT